MAAFKLGMTVGLCMAYNAHARFDDLDFYARSQWVGRGNLRRSPQLSKVGQMSITLAATSKIYIFFLRDLDFENGHMA